MKNFRIESLILAIGLLLLGIWAQFENLGELVKIPIFGG